MSTNLIRARCIEIILVLGMAFVGRGQETSSAEWISGVNSSQVLQNQAKLQAFQQEQKSLAQQRQALIGQGATRQQLAAWHQQNASELAALRQQANAFGVIAWMQLRPTNNRPNIPVKASPKLSAFLTAQANLINSRAQIHNEIVQQFSALGNTPTLEQLTQTEEQQLQLFRTQHSSDLELQAQRAKALNMEAAQASLPAPSPLRTLANATPQIAALLTEQHDLIQQRRQLMNQYANANPDVRRAAMVAWRQQNAAIIKQLLAQAQSSRQAN